MLVSTFWWRGIAEAALCQTQPVCLHREFEPRGTKQARDRSFFNLFLIIQLNFNCHQIKFIFPKINLICWQQDGLSVPWPMSFFFLIFSLCSVEEGQWASSWVGIQSQPRTAHQTFIDTGTSVTAPLSGSSLQWCQQGWKTNVSLPFHLSSSHTVVLSPSEAGRIKTGEAGRKGIV